VWRLVPINTPWPVHPGLADAPAFRDGFVTQGGEN
jgi:hypothetical protein